MNSLPSFARVCARRTIALQSPSHTPSTLQSITRPQTQPSIKSSSRFLTTSTISSAAVDDLPIDLPPSSLTTAPQSETTSSLTPATQPSPSSSLSTTSPFLLLGTISRTGTMKNCIQITQSKQIYDPFLQKHFTRPSRMLIHDPNPPGYLVPGDVIEFGLFSPAERAARLQRKTEWDEKLAGVKRKGGKKAERTKWRGPKMVVRRVVTAFGMGVDERMERIVRLEAEGREKEVVKVKSVGKKGRVGKQHGSAKVAG